jgi:hypothetical protein
MGAYIPPHKRERQRTAKTKSLCVPFLLIRTATRAGLTLARTIPWLMAHFLTFFAYPDRWLPGCTLVC